MSKKRETMKYELDMTRIPQHIAIIMDGNGRWATERGLDRSFGHKEGVEAVRRITSECSRLGVKFLTLYTFSTENWNRPAYEIEAIMDLIINFIDMDLFSDNNVRFRMVGDFSRLSDNVQRKIQYMEESTSKYDGLTMVVALSYSSRWELTDVVRKIVAEVHDMEELPRNIFKNLRTGGLRAEDITEEFINERLCTSFMPDPDLLIRTGGELRISNFLLWQIAYSELYFCDTYWPDFMEENLHKAIASYQSRQRRFGKTEAQVEDESEVPTLNN